MKKVLLALALAAALGVGISHLAGAGTTKSSASTWIVNDDSKGKGKCDHPNFSTIQAAVSSGSVSSGDTLTVCPGAYSETNVTKSLTINGPGTAPTSKNCKNTTKYPYTDPATYAVVTGGFDVDGVDNVTISGFTLQGGDEGVHTTAATDFLLLRQSVVQSNTIGVYFRGTHNTVDSNCIRSNNRAGSASGNGIYSEGLTTSLITNNSFYNNNNGGSGGGVNLPTGTLDQLTIDTNTSDSDANFVSATGVTNSEIAGNTVTNARGGAIYLTGDNQKVKVTGNTISGGLDDGIAFGTDVAPNDSILVADNTVKSNATQGIDTSTGAALTDSLIGTNTVSGNGSIGIKIGGGASANTGNFIFKNTVSGNGSPQCQDLSGGNTFYGNTAGCP